MERGDLERWIRAYEAAWRAPGTDAAAALFAEDATYLMHPFAEPVTGLAAIRALWDAEREEGEEFAMTWEVVAAGGDTGVARIEVRYHAPEDGLVPRPLDRAPRPRRPLPPFRGVAVRAGGPPGLKNPPFGWGRQGSGGG